MFESVLTETNESAETLNMERAIACFERAVRQGTRKPDEAPSTF